MIDFLCFGFLGFVGLYFLYRAVQWWMMVQQLKADGRNIREHLKQMAAMQMEDK